MVGLGLSGAVWGQGPELVVVVRATGGGRAEVSFAYPGVASHGAARQRLRALLQRTGWQAERIQVTDESPLPGHPMTGVSFQVRSLMQGDQLPVLPLIEVFRDARHLGLFFLMGERFVFRGPFPYEDRFVRVVGGGRGGVYSYEVWVKDPSLGHLALPAPSAPAVASGVGGSGGPSGFWFFLVCMAFAAGCFLYWATERWLKGRGLSTFD